MLEYFKELRLNRQDNYKSDLVLWNNQDITIEGKSLFWKSWTENGIYFIHMPSSRASIFDHFGNVAAIQVSALYCAAASRISKMAEFVVAVHRVADEVVSASSGSKKKLNQEIG